MRKSSFVIQSALFLFLMIGCASKEIQPVELYPEDLCSSCRMAIVERTFAGELITQEGDVFKFDDLGCMEKFKLMSSTKTFAAEFVNDYESNKWLKQAESTIIETHLATPMSSGLAAFSNPERANAFQETERATLSKENK